MVELTLPCPGKLNLFLHILGRRSDGMHELQTCFALLDHGDELTLAPLDSEEIVFSCDLPALATADNLVVKAAHMLRSATGHRGGARLQLRKRLPAGGGVGGGSSDAATALLGLNHLWRTGLDLDQLAELGVRLGADVPVFVAGRSAWAEGVGERLTPLELPERWYLVVAPPCHVSTADVFGHKDLTRNSIPIKVRAFLEEGGKNDCQPLVERLFPQVRDAISWLSQYGEARLTGTGACVFAAFDDPQTAQAILAQRPWPWEAFVARAVNRSPLHESLQSTNEWGVAKR